MESTELDAVVQHHGFDSMVQAIEALRCEKYEI